MLISCGVFAYSVNMIGKINKILLKLLLKANVFGIFDLNCLFSGEILKNIYMQDNLVKQ